MALLAEPSARDVKAECVLVEAAVAGDRQAFARLYDLHLERIYRYSYYWLGNASDAEDLTQQVFLRAWQSIGRYRSGATPFAAWLVTIAHNLVVSQHRRTKNRLLCPIEFDLAEQRRGTDPEAEALATYDRQAVRRALLRLKPDQQQVVLLRYMEGFEYPAIAATLGKSEGNVRVILHRALGELRRLLSQEVRL